MFTAPAIGSPVYVRFPGDTRATYCTVIGHGTHKGRPVVDLLVNGKDFCDMDSRRFAYLNQISQDKARAEA